MYFMNTEITIDGNKFLINNEYTYKDREWEGVPIEGVLFNSRMIQDSIRSVSFGRIQIQGNGMHNAILTNFVKP